MQSTTLEFSGSLGYPLKAVLDVPEEGETRAVALFAHCFTCSKSVKAAVNISRAMAERGFGVFRFDFTGLGRSSGRFDETSFASNVEDIVAAAAFLSESRQAPALLIGHSLGGAAVLQAALRIDASRAVVTIGAPCRPDHVTQLFAESLEEIGANGHATVTIAGRQFTITDAFVKSLNADRMNQVIHDLRRALLIFHAPLDEVVGIENAAHIFQQALHPKSFVTLDDADHLLTQNRDSRYVGAVISAWADRYL